MTKPSKEAVEAVAHQLRVRGLVNEQGPGEIEFLHARQETEFEASLLLTTFLPIERERWEQSVREQAKKNLALEAAVGAWPADCVPGTVFPKATPREIAGAEEENLQAASAVVEAALNVIFGKADED